MESGGWTHSDISLPHLLSLIVANIPVHKEGKALRGTLDKALQAFMLETSYPEGLPKLSCELLREARKLIIHAASHALSPCNGQIESLVAAAHKDEEIWEVALQEIKSRFMVVESTKSVLKTIELATSARNIHSEECCCKQWREAALSYLVNSRTLYKISGATVLFDCSELQWKAALQLTGNQMDTKRYAEIAELCCLYISWLRHSILLSNLMQSCNRIWCSMEGFYHWDQVGSDVCQVTDAVETCLAEIAEKDSGIWWLLPPILIAAALKKGTHLFRAYAGVLSQHMSSPKPTCNTVLRYQNPSKEAPVIQKDDLLSRTWCLRFVDSVVHVDGDLQQTYPHP
ncbi:hypothetical protein KP509_32G077000 [Ceratopteris richardii]|uniref:Uncharacterized protein n=1 Tax=Ceratopteris richardii TaxID=49495 RepID=A0A8T2QWM0_CERRI|nr:hypothetical protein KP509_32G077000 [Ceratopteris richardii]